MKKVLIGLAVATLAVSTAQANRTANVAGKGKKTNSAELFTAEAKDQVRKNRAFSNKALSNATELKKMDVKSYNYLAGLNLISSNGKLNYRAIAKSVLREVAGSEALTPKVKALMNSARGQANLEGNLTRDKVLLLSLIQNARSLKNGEIANASEIRSMTYQMVREMAENSRIETIETEAQLLKYGIGIAFAQRGYNGPRVSNFEGVNNMGKVLSEVRYLMEVEGKSDVEARRLALEKQGGKELVRDLVRCT